MTNASKLFASAGIAALLAATLFPAAASAARPSQFEAAAATSACVAFNPGADVIKTVEDGVGDYLVWVHMPNADMIACNANANGEVFANVITGHDLLGGAGAAFVEVVSASNDPALSAETACGQARPQADVYTSAPDGLGDYLVWMEEGEGIVLCNASAEGEIYILEEVGAPLEMTASAETTTEAPPSAADTDGTFQLHPTPVSPVTSATPVA